MSVSLAKEVTIAGTAELKNQLLECVGNGVTEISIDGSEVERIDTAALQVLVAFSQSLVAHKQKIAWSEMSDVLVASAKLVGLYEILGMA
ncbi:MAG: STAS domain-containing protein [Gammaproteobacteria bacterium]